MNVFEKKTEVEMKQQQQQQQQLLLLLLPITHQPHLPNLTIVAAIACYLPEMKIIISIIYNSSEEKCLKKPPETKLKKNAKVFLRKKKSSRSNEK